MPGQSPVVLIHGAFQTAATWDLVAPRLKRAGRRVVVADHATTLLIANRDGLTVGDWANRSLNAPARAASWIDVLA